MFLVCFSSAGLGAYAWSCPFDPSYHFHYFFVNVSAYISVSLSEYCLGSLARNIVIFMIWFPFKRIRLDERFKRICETSHLNETLKQQIVAMDSGSLQSRDRCLTIRLLVLLNRFVYAFHLTVFD